MESSVFLIFNLSGDPLCEIIYSWSRSENDLLISSLFKASSSICMESCVFLWNLMVIYCHILIWLIEACLFETLAGFELQTLESDSPALPYLLPKHLKKGKTVFWKEIGQIEREREREWEKTRCLKIETNLPWILRWKYWNN